MLVACEESQRVCIEFRKLGHEAYSCDILECSGGHPEWHIQGDCVPLLNGRCEFTTLDGKRHNVQEKWDLIIAHPPCTYLTNAAVRMYSLKATPAEKVVDRWEKRAKAAVFFMQFILADCDKIAVENPVGFMTSAYRKPDQYINPYEFAPSKDSEEYVTKKTGLWLKNLPLLKRTNNFEKPLTEKYFSKYTNGYKSKVWCTSQKGKNRSKERSKTFSSIATAMAEQWGGNVTDNPELLKPSFKPEYLDGDPDAPICPNCRTPLNEMEDCDCGQKIDWSEE